MQTGITSLSPTNSDKRKTAMNVFLVKTHAEGRTPDQQDAYIICRWLQERDRAGQLPRFFQPALTANGMRIAMTEGLILGVE
mgnify:CR=1 FL=1